MDIDLQHQKFRPSSLSLVTVSSLERKKNIFIQLSERYRTKTMGFINNNLSDFYTNNSIETPVIVINSGSDPDVNRDDRLSVNNLNDDNSSVNTYNSQLVTYLTPPPTRVRRSISQSESISTIDTLSNRKPNRPKDSPVSVRSRHRSGGDRKDDDNISIGTCSIGPNSIGDTLELDINSSSNEIMDNRLIKFLSVMYALVLIVVDAILCIHDLDSEISYVKNIFIMITTMIGLIWITFLHFDIRRYKRWAIEYLRPDANKPNKPTLFDDDISINTAIIFDSVNRRPPVDDSNASTVSPFETSYRFLHGKHSGNFYLKIGMTIFCFGSIVHMGVQVFGQIHFIIEDNKKCEDIPTLITLIFRSVYSFYQLFMSFKYSNILINRYKTIARFALMHLVGTSLSLWFNTIINEAMDDYVHKMHLDNTDNHTESIFIKSISHQSYCFDKSIINGDSMTALPYLYPFTIEFNIILASVWYIIWTNIGKESSNARINHLREEVCEGGTGDEHIQFRSAVSFNVDCHASNRGLFGGLIILLATFITIVVFFTTQSYNNFSIYVYGAQVAALTIICFIVIPLAYKQMRKLDIIRHLDDSNTSMDDLLVLVPIPFYLLHYILLITAAVSDFSGYTIFLIAIYILTIAQVLIQSPFIVDSIRRCSNSKQLRFEKPGRELITFALILNITLWILNTFELKSVDRYHGMQEYYGKMTWMIISHTTLPLMLFYRFHSSVCLSDIWTYAYEKDHHL